MSKGRIFIAICMLLNLVYSTGCDEGLSSEIDFDVYPDSPVIINSDDKIPDPKTGDIITITAPWFTFGYFFNNKNNSETLIVVNLRVRVTNFSGGTVTEDETSLDISLICDLTHAGTTRRFIAVVPPGGQWREDGGCDSTWDGVTDARWRVYGLTEADSFTYTVEVTPEAYFTDATGLEISRYEGVDYMITQ